MFVQQFGFADKKRKFLLVSFKTCKDTHTYTHTHIEAETHEGKVGDKERQREIGTLLCVKVLLT